MSVNLLCNALESNQFLRQPFAGMDNGFAFLMQRMVQARAEKVLSWESAVIVCIPDDLAWFSQQMKAFDVPSQFVAVSKVSASSLMEALYSRYGDDDTLIWMRADAVLTNPQLGARLLSDHQQYRAEFTFAEGYPLGYAPMFLETIILPALQELAERHPLPTSDPAFLFNLIKNDINNFEIETFLAETDHRLLRADFHVRSKSGHMVCSNYANQAGMIPEDFEIYLEDHQEGLRSLPGYMQVQILETCPHACGWCPHARKLGENVTNPGRLMPAQDFLDLCRRFAAFAPGATVSVSLWGEPSLHPEIYRIIQDFGTIPDLKLVIETSGVGWDLARIKDMAARGLPWLDWIVGLETIDPEMYKTVRGTGFDEAFRFASILPELFPGHSYVQALRAQTSERKLPEFARYWKNKNVNMIIQKYDHFCNTMEDLRVTDIAPLDRFACWHLKRDLTVLVDGRLSRCREDLDARDGLGNALTEDLAVLWERMDVLHRRDLAKDYDSLCGACDEYYSFNF